MLLTLVVTGAGAALGARLPPLIRRYSTAPPPARSVTAGVTAVAFGLLAASLGADPVLPALLGIAAVGVVLAFVDLACLRLPDPLVLTMLGVAVGGLTGAAFLTGTGTGLVRAAGAGAACLAGYVVLALLPGSRLGFGDVKLGGVLGLPLGWLGWDTVLSGVVLPYLLGGPVALALLLTGRIARDTPLPFGPALLTGALLAVALTA
ncbi:prepilin peptidase [Polymorphospora lycopeni]|uniref:Prepilin peptidase n=1 Tax=Polymorphospora lycopeni TaxID=3140240 RepID=A0ABV5CI04_9ACTN